jgi:hypothetical protein
MLAKLLRLVAYRLIFLFVIAFFAIVGAVLGGVGARSLFGLLGSAGLEPGLGDDRLFWGVVALGGSVSAAWAAWVGISDFSGLPPKWQRAVLSKPKLIVGMAGMAGLAAGLVVSLTLAVLFGVIGRAVPPLRYAPYPLGGALSPHELDIARQLREQCAPGLVSFDYSPPFRQGHTSRVIVQATFRPSGEPPLSDVKPSQRTPQAASVCDQMKVDLEATSGFSSLKRQGEDRLSLSPGSPTEWAWEATPTKAGHTELRLTAYMLLDGDRPPFLLRSYPQQVHVQRDLTFTTQQFVTRWGVPLGVTLPVLITGVGYLWRRFRGRREEGPTHTPSTQPTNVEPPAAVQGHDVDQSTVSPSRPEAISTHSAPAWNPDETPLERFERLSRLPPRPTRPPDPRR